MPADGLQQLEKSGFEVILMGPAGSPIIPDHVTLWGLLLPIRQDFDQYVNLRPMRQLDGVTPPLHNPERHPIDMVCIRENSKGKYAGVGGGCTGIDPRRWLCSQLSSPAPPRSASCTLPSTTPGSTTTGW